MTEPGNRFCSDCGHALAQDAKFCSGCGTSLQHPANEAHPTPTDQPPTPTPQPKTISKKPIIIGVAVVAAVVFISVTALVLRFITSPHYDTTATTFEGALGNRSGEAVAIITKACDSLQVISSETMNELNATYSTVESNYTYAYDMLGGFEEVTTATLNDWATSQLRKVFGGEWSNFKKREAIATNFLTKAGKTCDIATKPDTTIGMAMVLDQLVDDINNPGSWEPAAFYQSPNDPNLAYLTVSGSDYTCPYSYSAHTCTAAKIRVNQICPSGIEVTFGMMYNRGGTTVQTTTEYLYDAVPGKAYFVMSHYYGEWYPYFNLESLTCG